MPEMRIFCKHFSVEWLPVSKTPEDLLKKRWKNASKNLLTPVEYQPMLNLMRRTNGENK
jgi:hypothetical protein